MEFWVIEPTFKLWPGDARRIFIQANTFGIVTRDGFVKLPRPDLLPDSPGFVQVAASCTRAPRRAARFCNVPYSRV